MRFIPSDRFDEEREGVVVLREALMRDSSPFDIFAFFDLNVSFKHELLFSDLNLERDILE